MRPIRRVVALVKAGVGRPASTGVSDTANATFVTVAKAGTVPVGGLQAFDAGGRRVAVANAAGTFYAFDDTCTHRGCSLASGDLEGTTVTCICHGSQFNIATGAVIHGPAQRDVTAYKVRVAGDELQVEA